MIALILSPAISLAAWTLDNDSSQVSFVSVKAGDAGEVHRFTEMSGEVSGNGHVSVIIQLASVDTLIPIRDERMREMLFQTELFPTASITANIDTKSLGALEPGDSVVMNTNFWLELRKQKVEYPAEITVARLGDHKLMVSSRKPVIVNAASVDLVEGIEALRQIANLPSISKAVPVSFVLTFDET